MGKREIDVLVIGAGPAGLTAAIYLARFHLSVLVIDGGQSRAALIPKTRNHAGYPGGIAGVDLLALMRNQVVGCDVAIEGGEVTGLVRDGERFAPVGTAEDVRARAVLLATGVVNHRPAMPDAIHDTALATGLLRYCPICDGFEVTDKRVGVVGTGERGLNEALFLRGYTRDLTLIAPEGPHELADEQRRKLAEAEIVLIDGPVRDFAIEGDNLHLAAASGTLAFDSIYPAMGSRIRSELATGLGAEASEDGCLVVDEHQRTSIDLLYAAGDVVKGLDQISHAMGEGGVAATALRNDLAKIAPLYR